MFSLLSPATRESPHESQCYSVGMTGETEAAGDVLTGALVGRAVEPATGAPSGAEGGEKKHAACLNCGTRLTGAYCANCGQSAHLHRSLISLGHDILHGVFHFEGKIWRTLPELFFHPGRLTRRYIDGERAKFVSPMALFLFTVFLMFAVFSLTGFFEMGSDIDPLNIRSEWQKGNRAALDQTNEKIEQVQAQLADASTPAEAVPKLEAELAELESARDVMEALAKGDFARIAEIEREQDARAATPPSSDNQWPKPGTRLHSAIQHVKTNPALLLYKIKTNAYKFSWALIPLSVPFLWLMFFWRRDVHVYDHAIFTTYSISFMMLFMMLVSLVASLGVPTAIWGLALTFIPPLHMYKQLRGTYALSRAGALLRLFLLSIFIVVVVSLFLTLLLFAGLLS